MKTSILLYSRESIQTSEVLALNLSHAGYSVEQSYFINLPRVALNSYSIIHFVIQSLPLTANELICLKVAQALGRIVVLTIIDSNLNTSSLQLQLFRPDGFTVSQTNHLQYYRKWSSFRMILPSLPDFKIFENLSDASLFIEDRAEDQDQQELYYFLFSSDFSEVSQLKTEYRSYYDGRYLLKDFSASELRKKWQEQIKLGNLSDNQHLILSKQKTAEIFKTKNVTAVLCHPNFLNHELTEWIELATFHNRFVILNEHQAAGFSHYWTSGQNCFVVSEKNWLNELLQVCRDQFAKTKRTPWTYSKKKSSELYDPLINEVSRLYTKILHQKTRLLRADSANI